MKKLLFLIIISVVFYAIWRWNSPYPSPLNWDIWEHQTVINSIRGGAFALLPSQLSDTFRFNGYTTLFHVLIAGVQSALHVQNIPGFWWIAEGIFFVLTTLAAYTFVFAITKNRLTALAGGILSAGFFESAVAFTTLFLLPQTVAALLWVVGMTVVITQKTKQKKLIAAVIATLVILPFHAIVGVLGAVFLFIMALEPNVHWALVLFASYLIPTFLTTRFGLAGLNVGEAQYFTPTLVEKLTLFRQWYGFLPVPFLLLGLWKGNRTLTILLAATIGLIASPFPYVLKFIVLGHYILIAGMAAGMGTFFKLNAVTLSVLTAAALLIFYSNTTTWKKPVIFRGIASHVSVDEAAAAAFLKSHYGSNTQAFLISDPATQYILEPLSGVDTQGGAYMSVESRQNLLKVLRGNRIPTYRTTLLAISARTSRWLSAEPKDQMSIAFNIWRPDALSVNDALMIDQWKNQYRAIEVYRNPSIVIFEL